MDGRVETNTGRMKKEKIILYSYEVYVLDSMIFHMDQLSAHV